MNKKRKVYKKSDEVVETTAPPQIIDPSSPPGKELHSAFLPFAAILNVVCEEFDQSKPVAMLINSDISGDDKKEAEILNGLKK